MLHVGDILSDLCEAGAVRRNTEGKDDLLLIKIIDDNFEGRFVRFLTKGGVKEIQMAATGTWGGICQ
jgi:hypothetical protein